MEGPVEAVLPPLATELSPEEMASYRALQEGKASPEELLRGALLASGVSPKEVERYEKQARRHFDRMLPELRRQSDPAQRVRLLLLLMHRDVLRSYVLDQSYADVLLDRGVYNCLSSSLLFNVYAGWLGLRSGGVLLESHPLSWVEIDGRVVPVEPTDPQGFEPNYTGEQFRVFLERRRLEPGDRTAGRQVSNANLVARILTDRLVFAHDADASTGLGPEAADERRMQVAMGIGRRLPELLGRDAVALGEPLARLERVAVQLAKKGLTNEALHLQRSVVELLGPGANDTRRAERTLIWTAGVHVDRLARADRITDALQAISDIRAVLCRQNATATTAASGPCNGHLDNARSTLWNAALDVAKEKRPELAWRIAHATWHALPTPGGEGAAEDRKRVVHFARAELDRRWERGEREAVEPFVREVLEKLDCATNGGGMPCAELANRMAVLWGGVDGSRVFPWARTAFEHAPNVPQLRENLRVSGNAELQHQAAREHCEAVLELATSLEAATLVDEASKPLISECRAR